MKLPCSQLEEIFLSAARFAIASPLCWNFSTQIGVRTATTAESARWSASLLAVLVVIQPPQLNPTMARAIAPPAAPQRAGFVCEGSCMVFAFRLSRDKGFLPLDQIHGASKFQKNLGLEGVPFELR